MQHDFDLLTGRLAIDDPAMGLATYTLSFKPGKHRLESSALRLVDGKAKHDQRTLVRLDFPCVFALDRRHVDEFKEWYHRIGNECSYNMLTISERLAEFESAVGCKLGFVGNTKLPVMIAKGSTSLIRMRFRNRLE